ncbi:anti-sigma regulatory factor [Stackebrandtia soli]|uniref:anti-sigma regulatory factor n=1 Tax=Stackebrandtia soli TaxID=1892856 RepID=UPI0039E9F677
MGRSVAGDVLLLDIPAAKSFLPVLRTATAGLATRLDFGLGAIEDLRVAVDEAAGLLISATKSQENTLDCRFDVTETELIITIGATGVASLPPRRSFPWHVLDALAGEVSTESVDGVTTVRVTQRRPAH